MTFKTYKANRSKFLEAYKAFKERFPHSGLLLARIRMRNFKEFIFLYSLDNPTCVFINGVSSIEPVKFKVKSECYPVTQLSSIHDIDHSLFDKFPDNFERANAYYQKIKP